MAVRVEHGDSREIVPTLPADSVHAVVCDPPYHLTSIVKRYSRETARSSMHDKDRGDIKALQYKRLARGFMGKEWDGGDLAFQPAFWSEVLRVLKPGGHLIAFGGTRTYHRLACAIEDAGFEIRDQIGWLYGSGFPKSHDVSKAIDRAAGAEREVVRTPMGPTGNKYAKGLGDPRPWMTEAAERGYHEHEGDEPVTPAARQWEGWGTALKPAQEPLCIAVKPLTSTQLFAVFIEQITMELTEWLNVPAADAADLFSDTQAKLIEAGANTVLVRAKTYALENIDNASYVARAFIYRSPAQDAQARTPANSAPTNARDNGNPPTSSGPLTPHGEAVDISTRLTDMCTSVLTGDTSENIARLWKRISVDLLSAASTFTIATGLRLTTDLRTLRSCLSASTSADTGNLSPNLRPIVLARKPLIGTVAANVLKHGTGAINVDGCRVGTDDTRSPTSKTALGVLNDDGWQPREVMAGSASGRWPANLCHDGSEEVIAAFPETGVSSGGGLKNGDKYGGGYAPPGQTQIGHGDSGSAARFFYTAKADADERVYRCSTCGKHQVGKPDCRRPTSECKLTGHPTTKPVDLMAYLCRLVTPKNGTVLDPFAGSGTTGMACMREGFDCILIEKEAEYIADIQRRLAHVRGEDAPLFTGNMAEDVGPKATGVITIGPVGLSGKTERYRPSEGWQSKDAKANYDLALEEMRKAPSQSAATDHGGDHVSAQHHGDGAPIGLAAGASSSTERGSA